MPRYVLEVMYNGTHFHGSQIQGEQVTVQYALNKALSTIFHKPVATYGASRTDEGVHALCNYYHFDTDEELKFDLLYKCNAILPAGVAVKRICAVADDFNVRFDAIARRYRYRIYTRKNPFLHERALFYPLTMKEDLLNETAAILLQYTQFESFAKRNTQSKTFDCTLTESRWERQGEELHYIVEGNRFLRGMVRGLVGTQLKVARGSLSIKDFRSIIEQRACTRAFFDVAGHGLYLELIRYKDGVMTSVVAQR